MLVPTGLVASVEKEGFSIAGTMEKPELGWRMAIATNVWDIGCVVEIMAWDIGIDMNLARWVLV